MVNFRQVTITNANNTDRIELNDFDGYLMTSPTGFGIYRNSEYIVIGNQRLRTINTPTFQKITFNVLMRGARSTWEVKYARLRDFISKYMKSGFRLYYTPHDETRYIRCDINVVDKTEKDRNDLPVKLEIQPLSLWLMDVNKNTISSAIESDNLFQFDEREFDEYTAQFNEVEDVEDEYERPYYSITFGAMATNTAMLYNAGEEETPLNIKVYGKVINPRINLKKASTGEIVQFVNFNNLTIDDGYYLEINSNPSSTYIEQVNIITGERFDREDFANIESNMYLQLPKGEWVLEVTNEFEGSRCYTEILYANQYYGG